MSCGFSNTSLIDVRDPLVSHSSSSPGCAAHTGGVSPERGVELRRSHGRAAPEPWKEQRRAGLPGRDVEGREPCRGWTIFKNQNVSSSAGQGLGHVAYKARPWDYASTVKDVGAGRLSALFSTLRDPLAAVAARRCSIRETSPISLPAQLHASMARYATASGSQKVRP